MFAVGVILYISLHIESNESNVHDLFQRATKINWHVGHRGNNKPASIALIHTKSKTKIYMKNMKTRTARSRNSERANVGASKLFADAVGRG